MPYACGLCIALGKLDRTFDTVMELAEHGVVDHGLKVDYPNYILESGEGLGGMAITHKVCGKTSHNPNDVLYRYCGFCCEYLEAAR